MTPDHGPSHLPNPGLPEISWPTGRVEPDVIARIKAERDPAVGAARGLIEEGRHLLSLSVPPFSESLDLIRMFPADKRKVSLIERYTYPARRFLSITGQGTEDEYPFNLILEARAVELFSDAVAPTTRRLFDSALRTRQLLGPLTFLWTGLLEPALLHPLKVLWIRALGSDQAMEKMHQQMTDRLSVARSRDEAHAEDIRRLIENGSVLEAIDSITRKAINDERNPVASYISALDAGRQRFHQFYEAAQAAGMG